MPSWSPEDLDAIDGADEIDLATRRADGTLRSARIVWIVRYGDRYPGPTGSITADTARTTTLRVDPA